MPTAETKCRICGRPATGVHYGCLACEGCKAFYRRGVENKMTYICYAAKKCTIRPTNHANCKYCRFEKCKALGMKILGANVKGEASGVRRGSVSSNTAGKKKADGQALPSNVHLVTSDSSAQTEPLEEIFLGSVVNSDSEGANMFLDTLLSEIPSDGESLEEDALMDITILSAMLGTGNEFGEIWNNAPDVNEPSRMQRDWTVTEANIGSTNTSLGGNLLGFMDRYMETLDYNRKQMALTVQSVESATEIVFGDQLTAWKACMDRELVHGELLYQPQTSLGAILHEFNQLNSDLAARVLRFAAILPGSTELDDPGKRSIAVGWKWMVFWLIHQAPFLTENDSYVTIGTEGHRWCRYWQDLIAESSFLAFVYKFCANFRDIGLTQTETYLVLAVVLFEPGQNKSEGGVGVRTKLELIHRHYTEALFDAVKRRCTDSSELAITTKKLEQFFGALRLVYRIHRHYLRAIDQHSRPPFRAIRGDHVVTVQEALTCRDTAEFDDPDEFNTYSPMTYGNLRIFTTDPVGIPSADRDF